MYRFVLYVNGQSVRSQSAVQNLTRICESSLSNDYELTVIDLKEEPHYLSEKDIIVSPTLDRELPEPPCRVVGDLSDPDRVLDALGIQQNRSFVSGE